MSACEICWTEASRKALTLGGSTVDRYRAELAAHPEHGDHAEPRPWDEVTIANAAENIDRLVTYRSPGWPEHRKEEGTITSVNETYVFVRFGNHPNGIACAPERLRYSLRLP